MDKRLFLLAVVLVMVFCGSITFALDSMGPAVAGLKKGQIAAGIDYSCTDMDLYLNQGREKFYDGSLGTWTSGSFPSIKIDSQIYKLYVNFGYGIMDKWEVFLRFNAANINWQGDIPGLSPAKFDGRHGFAIGFGSKATFYQQDNLKLGGLCQVSWASSDGKIRTENGSWDIDTDIIEYQFAIGPTYRLTSLISIYGGPFLHFVDGDVEGSWKGGGNIRKLSWDIDERSCFGGYVGFEIEVIENAPLYIEYQHTGAADALGIGMALRFGP